MVVEEPFDRKDAFRCEACGFHYEEKEAAEECEEYCETRNSCSSEITELSMERR